MKVLHAYNLTNVDAGSYQKAVAQVAANTSADVLLLEYFMEDEKPVSNETEDEEDSKEAIGYIREMVMGQSLLVPENVMKRDEIFAVCGLIIEAFPSGCSILQIGSFSGVFAAVAAEVGIVSVISDFDDQEEDVFCSNTGYPHPRIRYMDQDPAATLQATAEPYQPDAILITESDPDRDDLWPELIRHMKPGVPTTVVCESSCRFMEYLDDNDIFFEKTEPTERWLALQVTPIYAAEKPTNEDD